MTPANSKGVITDSLFFVRLPSEKVSDSQKDVFLWQSLKFTSNYKQSNTIEIVPSRFHLLSDNLAFAWQTCDCSFPISILATYL